MNPYGRGSGSHGRAKTLENRLSRSSCSAARMIHQTRPNPLESRLGAGVTQFFFREALESPTSLPACWGERGLSYQSLNSWKLEARVLLSQFLPCESLVVSLTNSSKAIVNT